MTASAVCAELGGSDAELRAAAEKELEKAQQRNVELQTALADARKALADAQREIADVCSSRQMTTHYMKLTHCQMLI